MGPRPLGGHGSNPSPAAEPGLGELAAADGSPRAVVIVSLAGHAGTLSRAVTLGDALAARVVHEALGRLLGLPLALEG
ncbi:hypothetical protein WMF30_48160 [Sorangium sp. So ce134]